MQRKRGFVSVVIPCFNHGLYLNETLRSVLAQTFGAYEIIVVDDGSDDKSTLNILKDINHPKIEILHKANGHVASARNYGIRRSTGEYILTLDADDQFEPDFLLKAIPILKNSPETGVITCYARMFDHMGNIQPIRPLGGGIENFLATNNCMASALFRYRCWEDAGGYHEPYNASYKGFEDWDFWLSVLESGWRVHSIPEYLLRYRNTRNSLSDQNLTEIPEMMKRLVMRHEELYRLNVADVIYKKELKIRQMRELRNSLTYRVGELLLFPLKFMRDGIRKVSRKIQSRDASAASGHPAPDKKAEIPEKQD
ncbi:MAG: glycosyltransferase family A protein [Balneolales bacterium]